MKIIIMGPQGCGKSTQAKLLSKNLKIPSVSSGDIFRELKNTNTLLGKRVVERLSKGLLVSDDDTMDVINQELSKKEYKKGFIIDGFPRNLYQAQNSLFKPDLVLYLEVPLEVSVERLTRRMREEDTPDLIRIRLSEYHTNTRPVLDFYESFGVLRSIDGNATAENVHKSVVSEVYSALKIR